LLNKIRATRLFRVSTSFFAQEREVLLAFFATRLLLWVLGWLAFHWIKHGDYKIFPGTQLWNLLYHWDAFWYAHIVAHGYSYTVDAQSSAVFFPLLPICVCAFRAVTGMGTALAGFLISNTALLGAVIILRRLVALDFPPPSRVPERTVWLLLLCPMTFFHSALYTESLFLLLSIGAVYFARQRRWFGAGIAGALLTGTHGKGIFILVPLLWEALVESRRSRNGEHESSGILSSRWSLVLVPSGLVAFMTYLHLRFGDALAFLHGQMAFHREFAMPWEGIEIASRYPFAYGYFLIGTVIVAAGLCILGFFKTIRLSYQLYAAAILLLCLSTSIWESVPRYLSAVFPLYITLAAATIRSEGLYILSLALSAGLMTLCLALFVCGYFMT
jgi:Gpi18-like mannosyltransferase